MLAFPPLRDTTTECGVVRGDQNGGALEGARKPGADPGGKFGFCKKRNATFPQEVIERLDATSGRAWSIGEHHVELVRRQRPKQPIEAILGASKSNRRIEVKGWIEQASHDQLWHDIARPDA